MSIRQVIFVLFMLIAVSGCGKRHNVFRETQTTRIVRVDKNVQVNKIVKYGNDVYYFGSGGSNFGRFLSEFIAEHRDDLALVSMSPDVSCMAQDEVKTNGYFVVFRQLK